MNCESSHRPNVRISINRLRATNNLAGTYEIADIGAATTQSMPDSDNLEYDPRRAAGRNKGRQRKEKELLSRSRDRSRSRSPEASSRKSEEVEDLEATRRARMARLRAEMEEEEAKLTQRVVEEPVLPSAKDAIVQVDESKLEGLDDEEQMKLLLGFSGEFGTTKNQKVEDNHKSAAKGAAAKHKERKYRQYMNRKNGFNRPLDKMD